jgi:subtilisin family serine protease
MMTFSPTNLCFCLAIATLSGHALAQVPQGPATPGTPAQQGGGGGRMGFGLSLDLGTLIRGVQSLLADGRYQSPDASALPQYELRQIIVSWPSAKEGVANAALAALATSGGSQIARVSLTNLEMSIAALTFPSSAQLAAALVALRAIDPAIVADQHAIAYPMQAGSATPGKQYAHELLKAPLQTGLKLGSAVIVGMIDTEVTNSQSLSVASFKGKRIFSDADIAAPADHGNGVAAVMAATGNGFEGLAQGSHLRAAAVMREVAPGIHASNTFLIAQALDWLVGEKVKVANLSLGAAHDAVLASAVAKVQSLGVVLVAAAGNGGPEAAPTFPAAYPGVIAATAIDANKRTYLRANRGAYVAIAAPGVDVWLPIAATGGKGKYMSGTSFSAPFVAAAVAQAMAQQPTSSNGSSSTYLQTLCSKASPLGAPSTEHGCGLLQM